MADLKGQEEFWLEQTFAGYPEYLGRCSDRAEQVSELTLSAAADFAAPPGRDGREAEEALAEGEYDLIICDLALPADERLFEPDTAEGLRLFQLIRDQTEGTPVIVLSGHADLHMMQRFFFRRAAMQISTGNCCFSVSDLDTSTRTQDGHIRNDTRDVSRRTTFA